MSNLESLREIFGRDHYSDQVETKFVYQSDASLEEGGCEAVVWPVQEKQLVDLVKWAQENKANLVPRGAGTGLVGGCVPKERGVVVDFSKMNRILDIDLAEQRVRVQPGVVLDDLNRILNMDNLFFPIIPGSHAVCTIGGMLAANAGGLTAIKYGKMENWVEMVKIIDGQANIREITGDQLPSIIGLEGTTGFITEAVLRITKHPIITYQLKEFEDPLQAVSEVIRLKDKPTIIALEFVSPLAAQVGEFPQTSNLLFIGRETEKDQTTDEVRNLWLKRESLAPALFRAGYTIIEDPVLSLEEMPELIKWCEEEKIPCFGHVGANIIHPHFQENQQDKIEEMYEKVKQWGGEVSGEHGIGLKKKKFITEANKERVSQANQALDPQDIINQNKII